jgi:predicted esterase
MHRVIYIEELYKVLEYSDYAVIEPKDGEYDYALFFFAGFNENASKYIYLFKNFFESTKERFKIKVIIPFLPVATNYPKKFVYKAHKFKELHSWYSFKELDNGKFEIIRFTETDNKVVNLIKKEIKKLKSSERIIMSGFSMGGRYLLEILSMMKIKTKFNILFKTMVLQYENKLKNIDTEEAKAFNENKFYIYISTGDKVVPITHTLNSVRIMKNEFKYVQAKTDNGKKHTVDFMALSYFEKVLMSNLTERSNF